MIVSCLLYCLPHTWSVKVVAKVFLQIFQTGVVITLLVLGFMLQARFDLPLATRVLAVLPAAVVYARWERPDPVSVLTRYPGFFFFCLLFTPLLPPSSELASGFTLEYGLIFILSFPIAYFFPYHWLDRPCARWRQTRPPLLMQWASPFADHGRRTKPTLARRHRSFRLS